MSQERCLQVLTETAEGGGLDPELVLEFAQVIATQGADEQVSAATAR
jgi:hypothetical protein